jgi:predicted AAA+ superfamily ATPase
MYRRILEKVVREADRTFPVLLLTGPRQVGKSTLLMHCAAGQNRHYVTLDDPDIRALAQQDPGLFVQTYPPPVLIDEVQYAPTLFSHIKMIVDRRQENGLFWLTGSQKFHLMQGVTESLAGRVAILDLLGFSQSEIAESPHLIPPFLPENTWIEAAHQASLASPLRPYNVHEIYARIWRGSFPKLYAQADISRDLFYRSYIQTYLQRDVRDQLYVRDEGRYYRFLQAVAARTGQLLNGSDLARDVDIDHKTAKKWLSVLEQSGLVFLLPPYFSNLSKRLVKAPKIYFLDTGLAAYLTQWPTAESLEASAMSGAFFETYVISELLKSYWHHGKEAHFYYYRDTDQQEVDLLIDAGQLLYPIEIKKTATPSRTAPKTFPMLAKLGRSIGQGAVICMVESAVPLSRTVTAIPVFNL